MVYVCFESEGRREGQFIPLLVTSGKFEFVS